MSNFKESALSVDFHAKTATYSATDSTNGTFVSVLGMPFEEIGSFTREEQEHRVRIAARNVLLELLDHLPSETKVLAA